MSFFHLWRLPRMRGVVSLGVIGVGGVTFVAAPAHAYEFRTRFVERIGTTDVVLGSEVTFQAGSTHRLRMQFGVFDDDNGPAPVSGWAGWNAGTFDADFGSWSRTPGRLAPFTFSPFPYSNGVPIADPFTSLTEIDNVIGIQTRQWLCGGDGQPTPAPLPTIYARNSFLSTYEVTVQVPENLEGDFNVTIGGHWVALVQWRYEAGLSLPPDCETGEPGYAVYSAVPSEDSQGDFTSNLRVNVVIPTPTAAVGLAAIGMLGIRRRR